MNPGDVVKVVWFDACHYSKHDHPDKAILLRVESVGYFFSRDDYALKMYASLDDDLGYWDLQLIPAQNVVSCEPV